MGAGSRGGYRGLPMRELPSGLVTFCFIDVEGSTRAFRSDPAGYPGALAAHHELVRTAFAAVGGVIVETEGDGLFAAFGDAPAAVAGCLQAQLDIAAHGWPAGLRLRSRMGMHCDQATPVGDGYVALGVHQAARVAAAAHGGQVLCSAAVAGQAGHGLPDAAELYQLGSFRLKDFDAPAPLFELRHPGLAGPFPPPRAPRVVPGNLRLARTSFVGREDELTHLADLVAKHRLVTILGPGGVGKTRIAFRLAAELTESFAQGAWVVELAAVADPGLVADAVARALPLPAASAGSPAAALVAFLAERELLLVLDNCEHVLAGAADLADRVLDGAPGVTMLATSRVPLDVLGEVRFGLQPLGLPSAGAETQDLLDYDAIRLFVERARAARPRFGIDAGNASAITEICRRLDGLPLALELAGARVATLVPGDLLARLEDRFSVLATSARGMPERHRTLEATLAWSYDLLGEADRILLTRLAIFAGRFPLDWIEQVCAIPPLASAQIPDLMDGLVAQSVVAAAETAGRTEYELLITIREYAAQRLADRGETAELERSRADFLARRLAQRDPIFQFTERTDAYLAAVAAAADDVRASLTWCLAHGEGARACALIAAGCRWWNITGRIAELFPLARQAVALGSTPSFDKVMTYYAMLLGLDVLEVEAAAKAAADPRARRRVGELAAVGVQERDDMLALARRLGDDNGLALALYCQADIPWAKGEFAEAARLFREAAAAASRAGSGSLAATIGRSEAEVLAEGDSARLARSLDDVIGEFRAAGDPQGVAVTLVVLAAAELDCGEVGRGVVHAAEGLRIAREHGYAEIGWRHLTLLAWAAAALGRPEQAARLLGAVEAALDRVGGKTGVGQGSAADRERVHALTAKTMGPDRLAALHAEGRALTEDHAAALALALADQVPDVPGRAAGDRRLHGAPGHGPADAGTAPA
jgi:predicted ATPase/class 3 adenylate cyclase